MLKILKKDEKKTNYIKFIMKIGEWINGEKHIKNFFNDISDEVIVDIWTSKII